MYRASIPNRRRLLFRLYHARIPLCNRHLLRFTGGGTTLETINKRVNQRRVIENEKRGVYSPRDFYHYFLPRPYIMSSTSISKKKKNTKFERSFNIDLTLMNRFVPRTVTSSERTTRLVGCIAPCRFDAQRDFYNETKRAFIRVKKKKNIAFRAKTHVRPGLVDSIRIRKRL